MAARKGSRVRFNSWGQWITGRVIDSYGSMLVVRHGDYDTTVHKSKVVTVRKKKKNPSRRRKATRRNNPGTRTISVKNFTGKIMRGADGVVRILGLTR